MASKKSPVVHDITPALLVEIRDGVAEVRRDLHSFRDEMRAFRDETRGRLDLLERRVGLLESRFDAHLDEISKAITDIQHFLVLYTRGLDPLQVKRLEDRIAALESRAG